MFKLAETLTDEMHFLLHRNKQRLLYQIGLIDDPWMQNDGFIMDDVYSQDPNDPDDKLKVKRSKSNERMPKLRSKLLESK